MADDESKANPYPNLPDPLVLKNGKKVKTAKVWWQQRRPEIVEFFDREIYGRVPKNLPKVKWEVATTTSGTNGDVPVVTKQLVGHVDNSAYPQITVDIQLTLTTPANAAGPVPVMLLLGGGAPPAGGPAPPAGARGPGRGEPAGPSAQQLVLAKGWGYASLSATSIQADNGAGLTQGIIGLVNKGQPRKLDDWGALRAWAWGASRALDYFETDKAVDARHVGVEGHSRYGKAALVAMAYDPRFAIVYISSSGEGGAKLHRRNWGELVENVAGSKGIPLDGRQLPQVRRSAALERFARGLARAGGSVRAAPRVQRRRPARTGRRLGGRQGHVPGRGWRRPGVQAAGQEGSGDHRVPAGGDRPDRRRRSLPPAYRRPHRLPNWPTFLAFADRYMKAPRNLNAHR